MNLYFVGVKVFDKPYSSFYIIAKKSTDAALYACDIVSERTKTDYDYIMGYPKLVKKLSKTEFFKIKESEEYRGKEVFIKDEFGGVF